MKYAIIFISTLMLFYSPAEPKQQVFTILKQEQQLSEFNHTIWNTLLQKHVSKYGHVNYKTFKKDISVLQKYITILGENIPNEHWSKQDKLAYWINAYNALTVDLILRHYPIESIKDINKPWDQKLWKLGSKWYNLDEIEHNILRKTDEPRIHFAIVCASISCPKLLNEAYNADNLEIQLTNATKAFLADTNRNSISINQLKLSKIFKWFTKDFTKHRSLIDFLNLYTSINISENAKINYQNYDWSLNE